MSEYILARKNERNIPLEDKIFGISNRAKKMIAEKGADKVINATIGSLLDDEGNLIVLSSVDKVFRDMDPADYADYAPIGGIPAFREAVKKAAFGSFQPKSFTEAVATPGGTGALRNVMANYSEPGDKIITSDWHWAPYNTCLLYTSDLSGGQKRRVAIAGVIAMKPEILILDEPTAGLNPRAHADILNMVKNIHETERNIIFLVSHNMNDIARMSDKVIVMDCGKVAMEGPPAEVFLRENELRNMGLALPDSMEITMRLKRAGMDINSVCLTMDEAADEIAKVLKK